ncbi:MAG: flagellar biosynthesis protein [Paracoccaceae bacterium]|nr:flagellar biosynthesis protein [Paracoccaceae bacterium]
MSSSLRLESFEAAERPPGTFGGESLELEEARLAAFESGYAAGWEEAINAQKEDKASQQAELSRNLQGLSFTYHEARAHVLDAVHPLFSVMIAKLLPEIARQSLPEVVIRHLSELAESLADTPATLEVHPASAPMLNALLQGENAPPFRIVEEPTLSEGQVYLRLGARETQINLDRAIAQMRAMVEAFFQTSLEAEAHG